MGIRILSTLVLLAFVGACATTQDQLTNEHDLTSASIDAVQMPVLKPLPRPLYLVLERGSVPSEVKLDDGFTTLVGFDEFVSKSLQSALTPYFESVVLATSATQLPEDKHFVADVKVESVSQTDTRPTRIEMRWSIGIRASEADEYSFAAAGKSAARYVYGDVEARMKELMENAIDSLQESWSDRDVMQKLRTLDRAPAQPSDSDQPAETQEVKLPPTAMSE